MPLPVVRPRQPLPTPPPLPQPTLPLLPLPTPRLPPLPLPPPALPLRVPEVCLIPVTPRLSSTRTLASPLERLPPSRSTSRAVETKLSSRSDDAEPEDATFDSFTYCAR